MSVIKDEYLRCVLLVRFFSHLKQKLGKQVTFFFFKKKEKTRAILLVTKGLGDSKISPSVLYFVSHHSFSISLLSV